MDSNSKLADAKGEGQRLLIYDRTCAGRGMFPGLSAAWSAGSTLYRGLRRIDAVCAAASWQEALAFVTAAGPGQPIAEIQFWGHGKWGDARIARDVFDISALRRSHPLNQSLRTISARLLPHERSLFWFRTCETFGADAGQAFAVALADALGARVAGHTHVIGFWQSGLHSLRPSSEPDWSPEEGLVQGTPAHPTRASDSAPSLPNTIHCLHGRIPSGF